MTNSTPSEPAFAISTEAPEEKMFTVDGDEYHLHEFEHLTPSEAVEFRTIARREKVLEDKCEKEEDERKLHGNYDELRTLRTRLLQLMTDMPEKVIAALRLEQQGIVLRHVFALTGRVRCTNSECLAFLPADAKFCLECGRPAAPVVIEGQVRELPAGEAETPSAV